MWEIYESRAIIKHCRKLPRHILKKYELWKAIIRYNGPTSLRNFKGFHDEALKGGLAGFRSSRLSLQYRVIYRISKEEIQVVYVEEITPHQY